MIRLTWLWLCDNSDRRYWLVYKRCFLGFVMAVLALWFLSWLAYATTNLPGYIGLEDPLYLAAWWILLTTIVMALTRLDEDLEKNSLYDEGDYAP